MTAKEYLSEIGNLRRRADVIRKRIADLNEDMTTIGAIEYDRDRVQTSPTNRQEDKVIKIVDIKTQYEDELAQCYELEKEIIERINKLSKQIYVDILIRRFVELKPNNQMHTLGWIADEMGYSEDWIKHQYGLALTEFEGLWLN